MGLPPDWWKYEKWRRKAPQNYFLDPQNRRYPYKTHTGKISCSRLLAAIILARLHKDREILEKAQRLYKEHCEG